MEVFKIEILNRAVTSTTLIEHSKETQSISAIKFSPIDVSIHSMKCIIYTTLNSSACV